METSREDFGIALRSAFLSKGTKQKFSLLALVLLSVILIYIETIETKPLNFIRSFIKDIIYRGSVVVSLPAKAFNSVSLSVKNHVNVYNENLELKKKNDLLKKRIFDPSYLKLENEQLRKWLEDQMISPANLISSRVMLDKQSPYLNSFIINSGSNKNIKKGMEVLDGKNFIGRIVDVNFFSSRVLLVSDLNSRIPVIIEPSGDQAILIGQGKFEPVLQYLPQNYKAKAGDKVYTSGKEGIFSPGIPLGEVLVKENNFYVSLFSDLSQIVFVNVNLGNEIKNK